MRMIDKILKWIHQKPVSIEQIVSAIRDNHLLNIDLSKITIETLPIKGRIAGFFILKEDKILIAQDLLRQYDLIVMLCHELVHVEQKQRGDMSYTDDGLIVWKGKIFDNQDINWYRFDSPWEVEAYSRQAGLAAKVYNWIHFGSLI